MNPAATEGGAALPKRRQLVNVFLVCMLTVMFSVMYILRQEKNWGVVEFHMQPLQAPGQHGLPLLPPHCGGVLKAVAQGHWVKKNMTLEDKEVMVNFFRKTLTQYHVPYALEREDGQCNNVTYVWDGRKETETVKWFKAICNPMGSRPCCRDNQCVNETPEECRCLDCLDFRNQVHAEYATWVAKDASCQYRNFSLAEACAVARGSTLVFVGDSFMRHVYTAALQLLSGNPHDVALRPGTPKDVHDTCTGMMMYTEKLCRLHLRGDMKLCNNTVNVQLRYLWTAAYGAQFLGLVKSLANTPNSYVFAGVGLHNRNNVTYVFSSFTKPVVDFLNQSSTGWPKLVWMGTHAQGMFKTPNAAALNQHNAGLSQYVRDTMARLEPYGTPVFDSYNMTVGVASFDGSHFGLGVNFLKMQVLLNYVLEVISGVS